MARRSRPPGFDMTYRPKETVFGPPLIKRLPSILYLVTALGIGAAVLRGQASGPGSWLFHYVVEEDSSRVMRIGTFAVVLLVSAVASVVRSGMRGVRIFADGVEARDVVSGIVPKLRRYRWAQIEQIVLDGALFVAFDLWDGSRAFLPEVSDHDGLVHAIEYIAKARAIPVRGGSEILDDEDPEPPEEIGEGP